MRGRATPWWRWEGPRRGVPVELIRLGGSVDAGVVMALVDGLGRGGECLRLGDAEHVGGGVTKVQNFFRKSALLMAFFVLILNTNSVKYEHAFHG